MITRHVVTEMDETMIQRCVICGKVISDYSNSAWPEGQQLPKGFEAGEIFTDGFCTTTLRPTDFIDCDFKQDTESL